MIKYRTGVNFGPGIEAIEVERETACYINYSSELMGRTVKQREKKGTGYHRWFDTWEEAHAYLLERAQGSVKNCSLSLDRALERLRRVEAMKP